MKQRINDTINLDKWLYLANIFTTIELAREAITNGNITYNGQIITNNIDIENFSKIKINDSKKILMVTNLTPPMSKNNCDNNPESMYITLSLNNNTNLTKNYIKLPIRHYMTSRKNINTKPATKKSRFLRRSIIEHKKHNINNQNNFDDS